MLAISGASVNMTNIEGVQSYAVFKKVYIVYHRSIQSQLQTKNVQAIWHMPNYSLISWAPETGKNKKI